jgi:SAM-dependent methyltransferase
VTEAPKPDTILHYANEIFAPLAMLSGMQLDLFSALKEGPKTAGEIAAARALKAAPARVEILLDALVAAGLLSKQDSRYANTEEAQAFLVKSDPRYMGGLAGLFEELWPAGFLSARTLVTGTPQAEHAYDTMDQAQLAQYYEASFPGALKAGGQLADLMDWSAVKNLLDVGGGSGGVSIGLARRYEALSAVVFDFPTVIPFTQEFIAQENMADRIATQAGSIVEDVPDGRFDAAILRNLVQALDPDQAKRALGHVGQAITPGGRIVIWGWATDDSGLEPKQAALHNLVFLNFYERGAAHKENQYRAWLEAAGFGRITRRILPGGFSLFEAVKT